MIDLDTVYSLRLSFLFLFFLFSVSLFLFSFSIFVCPPPSLSVPTQWQHYLLKPYSPDLCLYSPHSYIYTHSILYHIFIYLYPILSILCTNIISLYPVP